MRYLLICLLVLMVWPAGLSGQAGAGIALERDAEGRLASPLQWCAETCQSEIAALLKADMQSMFPAWDDIAAFDGPLSHAPCTAAARTKPAVHAVILAPLYEHFVKLPGTQEDAKLLSALFTDRGAPPDLTRALTGNVDRRDMIDQLEASLACVREKDQVIVTFSGGAATYRLWGAPNFPEFYVRHCITTEEPRSFCEAIAKDVKPETQGSTTSSGEAYRKLVAEYDDLILFSSDVVIVSLKGATRPILAPESRLVGLSAVELSNFVTQVRNRGADAIVILDTNYAARARLLDRQSAATFNTSWRWSRQSGGEAPDKSHIVDLFGSGKMAALYAARGDEFAKESKNRGTILGELTFALAEAMRSRTSPSIKQLAEDIDRTMKQRDVEQQAVFEASEPDLRLLTPRSDEPLHSDHIEILQPALTRGASVFETDKRQFKLVARYAGSAKPGYAAIDGDNLRVDANGQFQKEIDAVGRSEFYMRVYAEDHSLLAERRIRFSESEIDTAVGQQGTSYVMTIGNDDYQDQNFPKLLTPIADADAFRDLMIGDFGYTDKLRMGSGERGLSLRNATQRDITQALFDIRKNMTTDDRLIIYYAGHGEKDEEKSFWVPVDGVSGGDYTWIKAADIQEEMRIMNAASVLLISDSCYAGGLTRSAVATLPADRRDKYLSKAGLLKSRQFIGSGGIEPVLDGGGAGHSIFAQAIIDGVKAMGHAPFTASELFETRVKPKVLSFGNISEDRQVPVFYRIERAGDVPASEFLFLPSK